jgi:diaminopimelate decarboxylase
MTRIYCSGLSGDGTPGTGVARSLRAAFAGVHLVGVGDSPLAAGLHDPVFDEAWVQGPRTEPASDARARAIVDRLDAGAWWISGDEREARWLAGVAGGHEHVLSPAPLALERVDADAADLAGRLGLQAAPAISTREDDWRLTAFGREHGWRLWLAGPGHEPARIDGWRALDGARAALGEGWSASGLRLQARIDGAAESIAFAAYRGSLLGAAHLRCAGAPADAGTPGGRVTDLADGLPADAGGRVAGLADTHPPVAGGRVAGLADTHPPVAGGRMAGLADAHPAAAADAGGRVTDLPDGLAGVAGALAAELRAMRWTGGGEIDLVRSADGALWLTALRPRFAAWVHGATLAGTNLPAALVGAATGLVAAEAAAGSHEFVRVVVEVCVRRELSLPEPVVAAGGVIRAGNYLSGMPDPARRAPGVRRAHPREAAVQPAGSLRTAVDGVRHAADTPHVHAADPWPSWKRLAASIRAAGGACPIEIAYSVKTDPDPALLRAARAHGFLAEAISAAELRGALDAGFAGEAIILNGPAKLWPPPRGPLRTYAAFADSLGELSALAAMAASGALTARYLGPRLRPPSIASRFGVRLEDFDTFSGLVATLRDLPPEQALGLHFHWASSEAGHEAWFQTVASTLEWGRALQELTGRAIGCLDLGGGWQPDDFESALLPRLPALVDRCAAELGALDAIVLEPGRALVQPLHVVEAAVLELRDRGAAREIVVDASLAEIPRANVYPHRLLSRSRDGDGWLQWGRGPDRVLGRLCMEDDVLRTGIAVPDEVGAGTRILIADSGGYDRSMSYRFGRA